MKKIFTILFSFSVLLSLAQVPGVTKLSGQSGATVGSLISGAYATPAASAILEGRSTTKGFLMPRMTNTQRNAISSPATGLQVYNTTTNRINYYNGTSWFVIDTAITNTSWSLTGNAGTTAGTNFIGATDSVDFVVKTDAVERLRLNAGGGGNMELNGKNFQITDTVNNLAIGIDDSLGVASARLIATHATSEYSMCVNEYGAFVTHTHLPNSLLNGFLSIVDYENSLVRSSGDGRLLFISNTDNENILSIRDSVSARDISVISNTDSVITLLTNYSSKVKLVDDAILGIYSDAVKWRIDSSGLFTIGSLDSATIYALTPASGTEVFCSNCTGNGITGRILSYIGAAWRRLLFED